MSEKNIDTEADDLIAALCTIEYGSRLPDYMKTFLEAYRCGVEALRTKELKRQREQREKLES